MIPPRFRRMAPRETEKGDNYLSISPDGKRAVLRITERGSDSVAFHLAVARLTKGAAPYDPLPAAE